MSRIIAVGDPHGRDFWKKVAEKEKGNYDKFVFMGDYFDNFPPFTQRQIIDNFKDILEFKKISPEKVVLLIGNRDFHYMACPSIIGEKYSGHNAEHADEIGALLDMAYIKESLMQMAYFDDDILFTHAGVSKTWLDDMLLTDKVLPISKDTLENTLNDYFRVHPLAFGFSVLDKSGYGESIHQSPIWIRPDSLKTDMPDGLIQVMGHSVVKQITTYVDPTGDNGFALIDAPEAHEYLIIEDGIFSVGKI